MVCVVHLTTYFFVIAFFESNTYFHDAIFLTDNIFSAKCIFSTHFTANLFEHVVICITESFYIGVVLLNCNYNIFAALATIVVGARCQLMFYKRVEQNEFVALRIKWEVLVLE